MSTEPETATGRTLRLMKAEWAEEIASMIEGYVPGQIRMAAGEMTAQEMRTVQAVQRWWVSAIRHKFVDGQSATAKEE